MKVAFAGGKKLNAEVRGHVVRTDQTERGGGEYSAPTPVELLVASLGTCIGVVCVNYIQSNGVSPDGLAVDLEYEVARDPARLGSVKATLRGPDADLGAKRRALVAAAGTCPVKRSLSEDVRVEIVLAD